MEFAEVVRRRRMVRTYDPTRPVPAEVRERLLEHAIRAPSAGFSQGWAFLVLEEQADRDRFWRVTGGDADTRWLRGMRTAPLIIVPHSHKDGYLDRYAEPDKGFPPDYEDRWRVPYWYIDTGFASMLMLLDVVDRGLGALFFSMLDVTEVKANLNIPDRFDPVGGIALGYRAPDTPSDNLKRGRKPLEDVLYWNGWDGKEAGAGGT